MCSQWNVSDVYIKIDAVNLSQDLKVSFLSETKRNL
jgi:hypothetical protein